MYRRAPIVWTSDQTINPMGLLQTFSGEARPSEGHRYVLIRREITLASKPDHACMKLTTDGKYQMFVNEDRLGRGPVRCDPMFQRYDTFDLSDALRAGKNVIALIVRMEGRDTAEYQQVRGHWRETFGDGAFWAEGEARIGTESVSLDSGPEWSFQTSEAWQPDTPIGNTSLGHMECCDLRLLPDGWMRADFDASEWATGQVLETGGGGPEGFMGGMKLKPFPTLLPRAAPRPIETDRLADRMVWAAGLERVEDAPFSKAIYTEPLRPGMLIDDLAALSEKRSFKVRTSEDCDATFLVEFDQLHSGFPYLEIEGNGGEVVDIACAERLPGEFSKDGVARFARPVCTPTLHGDDANVARFTLRPGQQRVEKWSWTSVRWLQIAIRNAPNGVRVHAVGSRQICQPVELVGAFECDTPFFNQLWSVGRETLKACMVDTWIDCPGREQRQWLGDVAVEFPAAWAAFGPGSASLTEQFLIHAAESQRPDGLTQMFAPGDHHVNAVLIPDWTLQWINALHEYVLATGNLKLAEQLVPSVLKAHTWFRSHVGDQGLIADIPHWTFFDWAGLGREGLATAPNALWAGTLKKTAQLCEWLGDFGSANRLNDEANSVAKAINAVAWDERRGVYVDMVDPVSTTQDLRVSQHANALMILHDLAPKDRWASMIAYSSDPDRLKFTAAPRIVPTGETLNPETDCVLANTFFSHFVGAAWNKAGAAGAAFAALRDRFEPMLNAGASTLWESYQPTASLCHGFSAGGLHQMTAGLLGYQPLTPGGSRVRLSPAGEAPFSKARFIYPSTAGNWQVDWSKTREGAILKVEAPPTDELEIVAPPGWQVSVENHAETHEVKISRATR